MKFQKLIMTIPKNRITRKLIISYIIAFLLSVVVFILFYTQLNKFAKISDKSVNFNENIYLVTETITNLYEMESIGKNLIKTNDSTLLKKYRLKVGKVNASIDELILKYPDTSQRIKINSVKDLLRRKNKKVEQLINIYKNKKTDLYYASAIKELKKIDPSFKDYSYINRFKKLQKHQRKYLINLLEYSKSDNEANLSNKTVDSIATSVTAVLLKLSKKEKQLQQKIEAKENEIIESDRILTLQIRSILTSLEYGELQLYRLQAKESKKIVANTYKIILFFTLLTSVMAFVFLYLIGNDLNKNNSYKISLEKAKKYTEELLDNRENLINMVTHDIRAPLNTIMGYLKLLEQSDSSPKNYISQMQNSSEYMLHLVNDLLDFSTMEAGRISIENIRFQPHLIIKNAIDQVTPKTNKKNIQLLVAIDTKLESLYISDPYRIRQIAVNLISNAYKFTEKGFVKIEATLKCNAQKHFFLKLVVTDSGVGIPIEKQQTIFEAFSQNKASDKNLGYGLGLYITKKLMDALQGQISLQSDIGRGSMFECLIPLQKPDLFLQTDDKSFEKSVNKHNEITVVLVDDEEAQLIFLEAILSQKNIFCISFNNSRKALDFIIANNPSLVITDIQMPIMDGFSLVKSIKAHKEAFKIPVIGLTGNSLFKEYQFKEAGFSDHLLKPYKPDCLLNKISQLLKIEIQTNGRLNPKRAEEYNNNDFDLRDIYMFMENDEIAVQKVLDTFCDSTEKNMEFWKKAIVNKNKLELKNLAHKMYPMFMQINARSISTKLKSIELETTNKNHDLFSECKTIQNQIEEVINKLKFTIG